jgi:hypothetical protein
MSSESRSVHILLTVTCIILLAMCVVLALSVEGLEKRITVLENVTRLEKR